MTTQGYAYVHRVTPPPGDRSSTSTFGTPAPYRKFRLPEVTMTVMKLEVKRVDFWRAVIGECLGTFFYVFLSCCATLHCGEDGTANLHINGNSIGPHNNGGYVHGVHYPSNILQTSLVSGMLLMALTYSFESISGSHFNPALTLAMAVMCKVTPLRAFAFCIAQLGGAIAGAALLYGLSPATCRGELGLTILDPSLGLARAFGAECLLTFLLAFVYFAASGQIRDGLVRPMKATVVGATVAVCQLSAFWLTRASMNPARSLGPAFIMNTWTDHWIYWVGPVTGATAAGLIYEFILDPHRGKASAVTLLPRATDEDIESGRHGSNTATADDRSSSDTYGMAAVVENGYETMGRRSKTGCQYGGVPGVTNTVDCSRMVPSIQNVYNTANNNFATNNNNSNNINDTIGLENQGYSLENVYGRRYKHLAPLTMSQTSSPRLETLPPGVETGEGILLHDVHVAPPMTYRGYNNYPSHG